MTDKPEGARTEPFSFPREELDRLLRELGELARHRPADLKGRLERWPVRVQAELALRLPAKERLELLLHAPRPAAVVRALPDADFYLTVREIGPADALPLLALGSPAQLLHLFDLESWRNDRFDPERAGAWVAMLAEAGEDALARWLRRADDEFLTLLFQKWARVRPLESEGLEDPRGTGQTEASWVSPDGFHRFDPIAAEHAPAIRRLLEVFFTTEPDRYFGILRSAEFELPSEIEEQEYRWRWSRLEEHGFPPWEEAITVYAPPQGARIHPEPPPPVEAETLPAARSPLRLLSGWDLLAGACEVLSGPSRDRLLHELASLANHVLVADALDFGDPRAHRAAFARAASYVGLALLARGARDEPSAARLFEEIPAIELFREGYEKAASLGERARRLAREGWLADHPRAIELLDPPLRARLHGLLEPRPLYFDAQAREPKEAFRDFRSPEEIEQTRLALDTTDWAGELLIRRVRLDPEELLRFETRPRRRPPRLGAILLTMVARQALGGEPRFEPLRPEEAADFLRSISSGQPPAEASLEELLGRFRASYDLDERPLAVLRAFGRACLREVAEEARQSDPSASLAELDGLVLER
jgi:hypothetical protein